EVTLAGIKPFCIPDRNPREVTTTGSAAALAFQIKCNAPPAGRLLAWGSVGNSPGLFSLSADGSDVVALTPGLTASHGQWSPDGRKILFEGPGGEGYVMGADGSSPTRLTTGGGQSPAWSPDGGNIVYATEGGLVVANADGSNPVAITSARDASPVWSPNGTRIAFSRRSRRCTVVFFDPYCASDLYTVKPDGSQPLALTANAGIASAILPAWSPDGARIAFVQFGHAFLGSSSHLATMNPDGSGVVPLANSPHVEQTSPVWSPDGVWIAYARTENGDLRIAIADPSGVSATVLSQPARVYPSAWK